VSRKKVLFDGHPGVELTFKMNQNGRELKAYSRHYAVDKTVYSLIIESFDEPGSADQEKFFDSFKITDESAAAAPKNVAGSTPSSGPGGPGGFGPGGPGAVALPAPRPPQASAVPEVVLVPAALAAASEAALPAPHRLPASAVQVGKVPVPEVLLVASAAAHRASDSLASSTVQAASSFRPTCSRCSNPLDD
jgi:hypothetical protein